MGHYTDRHTGVRYNQAQITRYTNRAKATLRRNQIDNDGYRYCVRCGRSDMMLDCSHNKSVQHCKNDSDIELIWDIDNMELLCRPCHKDKDGLN